MRSTNLARLAMWLMFVLTAGGLFGTIKHEGTVREQQLCQVVINVHENAKFRARTEDESLRSTREWLYDHRYIAEADQDELTRRVRENLPTVERRHRDAHANVKATEVPPICHKYVKKGQ